MKKTLYLALSLFIVAAVLMCFVACGGDDSDGGSSATTSQSSITSEPSSSTTSDSTADTTDSLPSSESSTDSTEGSVTDSSHDRTDTSIGTTTSSDTTSSSGTTDSSKDEGDVEDPEEDHEHTFDTVYSYDGSNHFYAATCGHTEEKKGLEAHSYNADGECKCGHVIDLEFYNVIMAMLAGRETVKSVTSGYLSNNVEFNSTSNNNITYAFYDKFLYIRDENDNINEYYYSYDSRGELFGICVQNDGQFVFRVDDVTDSNFYGAMYTLSCIGDGETTVFGAESLVEYFYKLGLDNINGDFATLTGNGAYSFSFMHLVLDDWMDYLYHISVSFSVNSATGALSAVNIAVNRYGKSGYTLTEDNKAVLKEGAKANETSTFTITLSNTLEGEMDNPYAYEKIAIDSVTVKDGKGVDIQSGDVSIRAGEQFILYFSDVKPDSALLDLCKITVGLTNKIDGSEVEIMPFYNSYNQSYTFTINEPGAYLLVVTVDDVQFISTLEVDLRIPLTMGTQVYDAEAGGFKQTRKATVYAGTPLYFSSYVAENYDGVYNATFAVDYGTTATLTSAEIGGVAATAFKSDVIGTYVVNVASAVDPYLVSQLKISVVERPPLESFLLGEYYLNDEFGKERVRVVFDEEHNATVTYAAFNLDETLACRIEDGKVVFESIDGEEGLVTNLYLDESFNLVIGIDDVDFGEIILTRVKVEIELVSTGIINIKSSGDENTVLKYGFEYYSDNSFIIYNGYSVVTDVALFNENGALSIRYIGSTSAVPMNKIAGDGGSFAGEYTIESVGEAIISLDKVPTLIREPEYGIMQVIDLNTHDQRYSAYYTYEFVNGKYVFYKDGAETDEVSLSGEPGMLTFVYPGASYSVSPIKISGEDDVLGGEYNINVSVGAMYTAAKIVFYPGANMDDIYAVSEPKYGSLTVTDADGNSVMYHYEIIDNVFVIYKDERKTSEIVITVKMDGSYTFHTAENAEPLPLVKVEGGDKVLAGVYTAGEDITITISSGNIPSEALEGKLEVVDDHRGGNLSGAYMYSIINESIVIYDRDGKLVESMRFTTNIDGSYSFQSLENNLLVPQALVKVDGLTELFGGVYIVNGTSGTPIYTFTFTPGGTIEDVIVENGALEITDNKDQSIGGAYTYAITDDGRILVYMNEELVSEFAIAVDANGKYFFSCPSLENPAALVKVNGEKGMLSGVYRVMEKDSVLYEISFMADGYVMPEKETINAQMGSNRITVPSNYIGINVTFTATQDGTYDFNFTGLTSNTKVYVLMDDGTVKPVGGTAYVGITLENGQSFTFYIVSTVAEEAVVGLNVVKGISSLPEEEI